MALWKPFGVTNWIYILSWLKLVACLILLLFSHRLYPFVPTFIELLVGAMLTQLGFITEAYLAINPLRTWGAYFKWLQIGKWSWVALGIQMAWLLVTFFRNWYGFCYLTILLFIDAQKSPPVHLFNISTETRLIDRIFLSANVGSPWRYQYPRLALNMLRFQYNLTWCEGEVIGANLMLQNSSYCVISSVLVGQKVITLVDSWCMKRPYLKYVLECGLHTIGQVWKDTVLYGIPIPTGGRGMPKKYGDKFTKDVDEARRRLAKRYFFTTNGNGCAIVVNCVLPNFCVGLRSRSGRLDVDWRQKRQAQQDQITIVDR